MKNILIIICFLLSFYGCEEKLEGLKVERVKEAGAKNAILKTGDILFQTSTSNQSKAIQLATHSKYSHVGIVLKQGRKVLVLEAVQPVKLTPIHQWIKRGKDENYVLKRLKTSILEFSKEEELKLIKEGRKHLNKDYDSAFEWSDEKMYCSELVWKIYKEALNIELSEVKELRDFDLSNNIVKNKMKQRYGDKIPLKEKVVSPSDIFDSKLLETLNVL